MCNQQTIAFQHVRVTDHHNSTGCWKHMMTIWLLNIGKNLPSKCEILSPNASLFNLLIFIAGWLCREILVAQPHWLIICRAWHWKLTIDRKKKETSQTCNKLGFFCECFSFFPFHLSVFLGHQEFDNGIVPPPLVLKVFTMVQRVDSWDSLSIQHTKLMMVFTSLIACQPLSHPAHNIW